MKKILLVITPVLFLSSSLTSCGVSDYYEVTFDSNGGSKVNSLKLGLYETYDQGEAVKKANLDKPADPTKENNTFVCWSSSPTVIEDFFQGTDKVAITGDTTLYAIWDEWGSEVNEDQWKAGINSVISDDKNNYELTYCACEYEEKNDEGEYTNTISNYTIKRSNKDSVSSISVTVDGEVISSYKSYEKHDEDMNAYVKFNFDKGIAFDINKYSEITKLIKDAGGTGQTKGYSIGDLVNKFGEFTKDEDKTNISYSLKDSQKVTSTVKFNKDLKLMSYLCRYKVGTDKKQNDLYNYYLLKFNNHGTTEIESKDLPAVPGKLISENGKSASLSGNSIYNCVFPVQSGKTNYSISLVDKDGKTINSGFKSKPSIYVDGSKIDPTTYDQDKSEVSFTISGNSSKILISCVTAKSKDVPSVEGSYLKIE